MNEKELTDFFVKNYGFQRRLRRGTDFKAIAKIFNGFEINENEPLEKRISNILSVLYKKPTLIEKDYVLAQSIVSEKYGEQIKKSNSLDSLVKLNYFTLSAFIRAKASLVFYNSEDFAVGDRFLVNAERDMHELEKGKPFIDFEPQPIFYEVCHLIYHIKSYQQNPGPKQELYYNIHLRYKQLSEELKNAKTELKDYRIALAFSQIGQLLYKNGQKDEFIKYATIALKKFNSFSSGMKEIQFKQEMNDAVLFRINEIEETAKYLPEVTRNYFRIEVDEIKEKLMSAKTAAIK